MPSNWLIWRGKFIEWQFHAVRSKYDLTHEPHFEITATDKDKDEKVTFPNVQLKDARLTHVKELTKLPAEVQRMILDNVVDTLEKEEVI